MDYPFDSIREEEEEGDQDGDVVRRGPWTPEEDALLVQYISCHGEGRWNLLAKCSGLRRTGKSCRLRWLNYLKPDIKRGNLTPQEQLLILELHSKWGNRWSKIAQHLPGRTDNEIKNYWRTRVQKHAKQLNMECNSQGFIDAIRCFYMPRLVEKIEQQDYSISRSITDFEAASTSSPSIFPVKQMDSTVNNLGSGVDDHMMMNCDGFKDSSSTETVSPSSSSVIMMMSPSSKKVVGSNPTHNIPVMNYGSNYQTSNALMEEGSQQRLLLSENGTTAAAASCYYVDSSSSGYDMNLEMVSIAHDDDHLDAFGYNNNHGWGSDNFVNDTWNLDPLW